MKITVELPDDLLRRVKKCAVEKNQSLKDTVAELLEKGMNISECGSGELRLPNPVRLRNKPVLRIEDIETAVAAGRK